MAILFVTKLSAQAEMPPKKMQISVVELSGFGTEKSIQVSTTAILRASFDRSGFFQVADLAGAEAVAVGKLTKFDDTFELSVKLRDAKSETILASAKASAASPDRLGAACDAVVKELRERLAATVTPQAQAVTVVSQKDERGTAVNKKPSMVSLYFGNRFALDSLETSLGNPNQVTTAQAFANTNMVRTGESIYKGSATLTDASGNFVAQPTMRLEYEMPFQSLPWMSLLFSLEGSFAGKRNLIGSAGDFRYENPQANHVALTNVTYTGTLAASDVRYNLTPMAGIGFELTNASLQRASGLSFLIHLAGGAALMSGKRTYELNLNPQYISAGSYSDTYTVKSVMTQSYQMAFLGAGRIDLGARIRLGQSSLYLALIGSLTMLAGTLPYDNYGYFSEFAGNRQTYQKITTGIGDESFFSLAPSVFLALSREL